RGCYRSRVPREYGLVALAVGVGVGAMYIRRKRDVAAALEERVDGVAIGQLEKPGAIAFPAPERHASSACNIEHVSRSQFLSGFRPRHEVVIITFVEKEDFEFLGAGGALAKHPRWNDACPVHDQDIAITEEIGEMHKCRMSRGHAAVTRQDHQTARGTLGG